MGRVECVEGQSSITGSGNIVIRRQARDEDIKAVLKLWGSGLTTVAEWLGCVRSQEMNLLGSEKERLLSLRLQLI